MTRIILSICASAICAALAQAQDPVPAEEAVLRRCTALADSGKGDAAAEPGAQASSLYEQRVRRNPRDVEALVGLARAKSQCLVPSANFMRQGELSSDAMELLDQALAVQPEHWLARYVLASIAYRSPAFLGRGRRAAQEFDILLRQQGDRTDNPMYARVFAMRGMQLNRAGQSDSAAALWARGAALFPNDEELQRLSAAARKAAQPNEQAAEATAALDTVQVRVSSALLRAPLPSVKDVSRSQVLLTAGGAADVMQAVQMQPGATRVGEGGDVYTRGGDASETALVVNGSRILSLARFEGLNGSLFGAIEPFIVRSLRYSSGGFSARHGNALSGVLEIETDGRPVERATRVGVSLVQAGGTVRVPFSRRLGAWISGRASHTGALLATHGRTGEFSGAPRSQEFIGSIVAAPTPFTEWRATALVEHDDTRRELSAAGWRGTFDAEGETRALMLSGRWMSSRAPLVMRASVSGSSRNNAWAFGVLQRDRDERAQTARVDVEWQATTSMMLRGGVEQGTQLRLDNGAVPTTSSVATGAPVRALDESRRSANNAGAWAESEWTRGAFSVTTGLRVDRLPGEDAVSMDPRIALSLRVGEWTGRLAGGVFHQGRWRGDAAIPDAGTPSGIAHTAQHLVAALERETSTSLLRAEAFTKRYSGYAPFGSGPAIARTTARGADVIAQRLTGSTTGFLGYSLLDATSLLADGRRVRGAFDVTHSITASVTRSLGSDWSLGSTVRHGTGAPRTPVIGTRPVAGGRTEPVYGEPMSERLPDYLRLDARIMRHIRLPSVLVTSFAELLNVTDRANVQSWTYDEAYAKRQPVHSFFSARTIVIGAEMMFR